MKKNVYFLKPLLSSLVLIPTIVLANNINLDDPLLTFIESHAKNDAATVNESDVFSLSGTVVPSEITLTSAQPKQVLPIIKSAQEVRSEVVVTALGYLDKPYVYGGDSISGGLDCSGFVLSLFKRALNLELPRKAEDQARATQQIARTELTPGDLVFFKTTRKKYSHVGIYVGDNRFIHAPRAGSKIRIESMDSSYWSKRFNGAHRVSLTG